MPDRGDFGVVWGATSFISRLISAMTRSPYTHTFLYAGGGKVLEATPGDGVRLSPLSSYHPDHILWGHAGLTDADRDRVVKAGFAQLGKRYYFLDILALGFSCLGITVPWVWNRLNNDDRLICSQFVVLAYRKAGLVLFPDKADCRVTPADLANLTLRKPVDQNR